MIAKQEFLGEFLQAIKVDSPEDVIYLKKENCYLLHDLKLDFDIFEDIMIDLANEIDRDLNIALIKAYLPKQIGVFDRLFNRVSKKYFSKYKPITVCDAANLIYDCSFAGESTKKFTQTE